jgi:hypothetical protein
MLKKQKNNNVLLLTACVNPGGMSYTKLQDANERLLQYKTALNWYLSHTNLPIVIVENTMTDFSADYQTYIDCGRLEFITFDCNNFDKSRGKGFGEMLSMKYAFEHSVLLSHSSRITKITGRVIVKNINAILSRTKQGNDIYVNSELRSWQCYCISNLFVAPVEFIRSYFLPRTGIINDSAGYFFEHALFDAAVQWIRAGHRLHRFVYPVIVKGISGTTGEAFKQSRLCYLKSVVKYFLYSQVF